MSVADHDAALAASSHVPHMVAYALISMLADHALSPMQHGGALRDMTRIAASDPLMWRDIALTNRELLTAMDAMAQEHEHLRTLIAEADGDAIETFFPGRAVRRQHDDILNPYPRVGADELMHFYPDPGGSLTGCIRVPGDKSDVASGQCWGRLSRVVPP